MISWLLLPFNFLFSVLWWICFIVLNGIVLAAILFIICLPFILMYAASKVPDRMTHAEKRYRDYMLYEKYHEPPPDYEEPEDKTN
ncbi:MAG TPA: hypothetical protein P5056_00525 [Candidatus Paceibacterota bacterium]|nr:hypothetical protein [Candidatus Paceibacterota bacterium]